MAIAFVNSTVTNGAGASSINISKPSGASTGDLCLIYAQQDGTGQDISVSGFTQVFESNDGGPGTRGAGFYKVLDGSEGATFSVASTASGTWQSVECLVYSGAEFDAIGTVYTGAFSASNTPTITGVTTTTTDCVVLLYAQGYAGFGWPAVPGPAGWTTRADNTPAATSGAAAVFDKSFPSAGATGSQAVVYDSGAYELGVMVSLKPAAAAAPTDSAPPFVLLPPGNFAPMGIRSPWFGALDVVNPIAYTSTLTGSITPAAGIAKAASSTKAGTSTPSGALAKLAAAVKTGTITPAGALAKLVAAVKVGSITPAGALSKADSKALAGTSTPTGALTKVDAKTVTGTITPTGALSTLLVILRTFTGSIASSGTLAKLTSKRPTGTITPAATLVRTTAKAVTATITTAGALVRATSIRRTGSITPTGALTTTRVLIRTLTGAITSAGTVARTTGKAVTGTVTSTSSIARAIAQRLTGIVTPAGVAAKAISWILHGAIALAGVVTRITSDDIPPPSGARRWYVLADDRTVAVTHDRRIIVPADHRRSP